MFSDGGGRCLWRLWWATCADKRDKHIGVDRKCLIVVIFEVSLRNCEVFYVLLDSGALGRIGGFVVRHGHILIWKVSSYCCSLKRSMKAPADKGFTNTTLVYSKDTRD